MARNRKNQARGLRAGPLVKACLLCLFIGGSGVGYVWQKAAIDQLGREIKSRETRLRILQDQNEGARKQLAAMQSPPVLEMRIKELNLGLVMPHPAQVLRLAEPQPSAEPPMHAEVERNEQQYAAAHESRDVRQEPPL